MPRFEKDPVTGEYKYVGNDYGNMPSQQSAEYIPDEELSRVGNRAQEEEEAYQQRAAKYDEEIDAQQPDDRPLFFQNGGQFGGDLIKSIVNPVAAFATDYVDLGHGLVDVARETGNLLQGNGFDGSKVFDDSDNPLTKYRIDNLRSETQAGQFVSTTLRVAGALLALPKMGIKGLAMPLRALGKAPAIGKGFAKGAKVLDSADAALKTTRAPAATKALDAIQKGNKGSKTAKLANADDWLKATYKDVVNAGVEGNSAAVAMRSIERSAKQLTKGKSTIRTVGEALAWDAFVAFNVSGEGNDILDETFSDFLADVGLPAAPIFQSDYRDTGLITKFKQMGEGLLLGGVLSSVFDVARIYRFSKAFQVADPGEQKLIIAALNEEGAELGQGLSKLDEALMRLPPAGGTSAVDNYSLLDEQLEQVDQARFRNQVSEEQQLNLQNYQRGQAAVEARNAAQGGALATRDVNATALVPTQEVVPATETSIEGLQGLSRGAIVPVRPPEPTITPQTIKTAFDDYVKERFQDTGYAAELLQKTRQLLPRQRVDAIEYMEKFPERFNALGMMSASDGVIDDYFVSRGLAEGWASFDADFNINFNRKAAYDLDFGDYATKQAQKIDEVEKIGRFNRDLQGQMADNRAGLEGQEQLDDYLKVRDNLEPKKPEAKAEGGAGLDAPDAPDPAAVEANRQAQMAGQSAEELADQADREVIEAAAKYGDVGSDRQIVAEMLGVDIDNLPEYRLEKLGRKYQVLDELGESVDGATYTTQKLANKALAREQKKQLEGYVAEARARAARGEDQVLGTRIGVDITDSALVRSELKLTARQAEVLTNFDIADLDPFNLQLDMTQSELSGLSQQVQAAMETATGPEKTVLKNVMKKLNDKVADLGPQARFAAEVQKSADQGLALFQNGRICL